MGFRSLYPESLPLLVPNYFDISNRHNEFGPLFALPRGAAARCFRVGSARRRVSDVTFPRLAATNRRLQMAAAERMRNCGSGACQCNGAMGQSDAGGRELERKSLPIRACVLLPGGQRTTEVGGLVA